MINYSKVLMVTKTIMTIAQEAVSQLLTKVFPDADIAITDVVGDGTHYKIHIISEQFQNLSRVQQHQLVFNHVGSWIGREIHALSLKTCAK